jgi:drug/metabolite transporter (DMT)-like permease
VPQSGSSQALSPSRSVLLLLGLSLLWGYNWVVMKIGVSDSGPVAFAAIRVLGGAGLLFVTLLVMRRSFRIVEPVTVAIVGLLQTGAAFGLICMALRGGEAGKSAVLNYTLPIWVMILSFLFLKERPRVGQWVATAIALLGILIMAFVGGKAGSLEPVLYALAASFCWGAGVVVNTALGRRHPGRIDPLVLTTWQLFSGGVALGLAALVVPEPPLQWTSGFIWAALYNVGPATALACFVWFVLQARMDANLLSLIVLVVPLVGVVSGWLQLGERPSAPDTIGMILILAAIALMVLTQRRRAAALPAAVSET